LHLDLFEQPGEKEIFQHPPKEVQFGKTTDGDSRKRATGRPPGAAA
jgi:hypothetical protein